MGDIGSAVGGLLTAAANIYSTERTNAANRHLAELSNQWSVEQWNRENAYNTPAAQMQRLREAGLNPNLVYAQGNLMNEAAQSPAVTSAAGTQRAWQIDPLMAAQIAKLGAEKEAIEHQTQREDEKQPDVVSNLQASTKNLVESAGRLKVEMDNLRAMLDGIKADSERKQHEAFVVSQTVNYLIAQKHYESLLTYYQSEYYVPSILADIGLKDAQSLANKAAARLSDKQRQQVDLLIEVERAHFNAEKPYLSANAHNDYVLKYHAAGQARRLNEIFDKYKEPEWWINTISGGIKTLSSAFSDVAGSLRGRSNLSINVGK